jgi:glycerophosphoryl diester phosphodiesterase
MDAYRIALDSQVDCIEIDVSRSSDGVLFALHDRYLLLGSQYFLLSIC